MFLSIPLNKAFKALELPRANSSSSLLQSSSGFRLIVPSFSVMVGLEFSWLATGINLELEKVGQGDSCPGWFQVLISDLRKKDSLPGLLQVLIWNLRRLDDEIVVLAGFRY